MAVTVPVSSVERVEDSDHDAVIVSSGATVAVWMEVMVGVLVRTERVTFSVCVSDRVGRSCTCCSPDARLNDTLLGEPVKSDVVLAESVLVEVNAPCVTVNVELTCCVDEPVTLQARLEVKVAVTDSVTVADSATADNDCVRDGVQLSVIDG